MKSILKIGISLAGVGCILLLVSAIITGYAIFNNQYNLILIYVAPIGFSGLVFGITGAGFGLYAQRRN